MQAKLCTPDIGQVLYLELCTEWLRHLHTKDIGAEGFEELQNMMLEQNKEVKMVRSIS